MANLFLNCKTCGKQFFSGVHQPPPEAREHHCTWCGDAAEYQVNDYLASGYSESELAPQH